MTRTSLAGVGLVLAEGYPSKDVTSTERELAKVVEVALSSLASRASSALNRGQEGVEEIWKAIREDSEELFAPALQEIERVKVIYVASKFANNKTIGELITRLAIGQAQSQRED